MNETCGYCGKPAYDQGENGGGWRNPDGTEHDCADEIKAERDRLRAEVEAARAECPFAFHKDHKTVRDCVDALIWELDHQSQYRLYKAALEKIRNIVHPVNGKEERIEGCTGCVAEKALGTSESQKR